MAAASSGGAARLSHKPGATQAAEAALRGSCTSMAFAFYQATSFTQELCWDMTNVADASQMFFESPGSVKDNCN